MQKEKERFIKIKWRLFVVVDDVCLILFVLSHPTVTNVRTANTTSHEHRAENEHDDRKQIEAVVGFTKFLNNVGHAFEVRDLEKRHDSYRTDLSSLLEHTESHSSLRFSSIFWHWLVTDLPMLNKHCNCLPLPWMREETQHRFELEGEAFAYRWEYRYNISRYLLGKKMPELDRRERRLVPLG